jgi:hypothetical protein
MKDKDPDIVFSRCAFLSVMVGNILAFIVTLHFFPVSTGAKAEALAITFQVALLATLVSIMVYVSDKVIPNPERKS